MRAIGFLIFGSLIFLSGSVLLAQEVVTSSGGTNSNGEGSVSYSVGQVFYETYNSTDGMLSHGVQQPFEILTGIGYEDVAWIGLSLLVYPNPVADNLVLSIERDDLRDLSYHLYDMNGKLITGKGIDGELENIDMSGLIPSQYVLSVKRSSKELKSFIIIKN